MTNDSYLPDTPAPYAPRPDSLAAQVIGHLTLHPGAELTLDLIVDIFQTGRGNIHTQLAKALEAGLLKRSKNDDEEYVYTLGKAKHQGAGANLVCRPSENLISKALIADVTARAVAKAFNPAPPPPGFADLNMTLEDNFPLPSRRKQPEWMALAETRINEMNVQQSFPFPIGKTASLQKILSEARKTTPKKFYLHRDKAKGIARCYRTA